MTERLFKELPQVGGHPALDLMNTVEYRGCSDPKDHLKSVEQLLTWCESTELIDRCEGDYLRELGRGSPADCERMRRDAARLREAGRKTLGAKLNGLVGSQAVNFLRNRIERAARGVKVVLDGSGTGFRREHPISGFDSLVDRIALSIEDAFAVATRESLRECEGGDCDWLFFDRSRAGRRRWCHSGQCGNAERVRNFRARRTAKALKMAD